MTETNIPEKCEVYCQPSMKACPHPAKAIITVTGPFGGELAVCGVHLRSWRLSRRYGGESPLNPTEGKRMKLKFSEIP